MAGYIRSVLASGEAVAYEAKHHWMMFFWPVAITVITLGTALFITGPWLVLVLISYTTNEMAITSRRFISKTGAISRRLVELRLSKIEAIQIEQGVIGRILDYGTVVVSGTDATANRYPKIGAPFAFKMAAERELNRMKDGRSRSSSRKALAVKEQQSAGQATASETG